MIYSENILICMAVPLVIMLPFIKGKTRSFLIALVLGMLMCLLGAYINSFVAAKLEYGEIETARFIAPIVEEIMKIIPILVYALLMGAREREIVNFSVAIGAGYATFENSCYIVNNGAQLFSFVLVRGLAVGIMHVLCGLVMGIALALAVKYKITMTSGILGSVSFAMTIHSLYNLLVSAESGYRYMGFLMPILFIAVVYFGRKNLYEEAYDEQ